MDTSSAMVLRDQVKPDTSDAGAAIDAECSAPELAAADMMTKQAANDAGAPPRLVIPEHRLIKAVQELEDRGMTEEKVIALVRKASEHEAAHAHLVGHLRGFRHALAHFRGRGGRAAMSAHDFEVPWHRSQVMRDFRYDIIERYAATHNGLVDSARGFYYGTVQVVLGVDGSITDGAFTITVPPPSGQTLNPVIDRCFDLAISQPEPNWFGGSHILDLSDTNLQNPGQNIYPDECFIIEALSTDLKAIRISYNTAQIPAYAGLSATTQSMLTGASPIWDRAGRVLPTEIFNQFDDTCEIAQAVAEIGVISFGWANLGLGANNTISTKPIERMKAVPGVARRGVQETSGAALSLDLPRGFLWMLDQQFQANEDEGGNGLFSLQLGLFTNVVFPFQPVAVFGSPTPLLPTGLALEWQATVWGTSLLPAKANRYLQATRRRT